jgi:DNA-binding protein
MWLTEGISSVSAGMTTERARDNSIFIGNKPFMNYVTGVVMQFTTRNSPEVVIKARGKFISRAVDVAEVAMKRFLDGEITVKDIKIDSDAFKTPEGKDVRVSTIDITLAKK